MGSFVAKAIALLLLSGSAWSSFVGTYQYCQILDVVSDFRLFWNPTGGSGLTDFAWTAKANSWVGLGVRVSTVPSVSVAMNYANFTIAYYGFDSTHTGQNSFNATGQIYYGSFSGTTTGSSYQSGLPTQTGPHGTMTFANIFYQNCRTCAEYYTVPVPGSVITVLWAYHNYTEAAVAVGGKVAPTSLANLGARQHIDRGYAQIDLDAGPSVNSCPVTFPATADSCDPSAIFNYGPAPAPPPPPSASSGCGSVSVSTWFLQFCPNAGNLDITLSAPSSGATGWVAFSFPTGTRMYPLLSPIGGYVCIAAPSSSLVAEFTFDASNNLNGFGVSGAIGSTVAGGSVAVTGGRVQCTFSVAATGLFAAGSKNINWAYATSATSLQPTAAHLSANRGTTQVDFSNTGTVVAPPPPPPPPPAPPASSGSTPAGCGSFASSSFGLTYCPGDTDTDLTVTLTLSGSATGWIALAFPDLAESMVPATGFACSSDFTDVQSFDTLSKSDGITTTTFSGSTSVSATDGNLVCSWTIDTTVDTRFAAGATDINWAYKTGSAGLTGSGQRHDERGSGSVDFGEFSTVVGATTVDLKPAHGALMGIGWGVFLPLGVLAARLLREVGDSKPALWFKIHRMVQPLAFVVTIIAFILIFIFNPGKTFTSSAVAVSKAHGSLGIIVMFLGALQIPLAIARPHKDPGSEPTPIRRAWEFQHFITGKLAVLLGMINCWLGLKAIGAPNWGYGLYGAWFGIFYLAYIIGSIVRRETIHNWP